MSDAEVMKVAVGTHFGLPVIDIGERWSSADWAGVQRCRPDDVGVVTSSGRRLTTEAKISSFWRDARALDA